MILGITGISGAGKHVASRFFQRKQWLVLDADTIAHHLYRPYTRLWKAVVKRFGEGILTKDDLVDRQKLRAIVFDSNDLSVSETALADLNSILHPEIRRAIEEQIHRHFRRESNIVVVAALWKELGLFEFCDKVLLIRADEDRGFARIRRRDGIDEAMYRHYAAQQNEPEEPHLTIENNGNIQEFEKKLARLKILEKEEKRVD